MHSVHTVLLRLQEDITDHDRVDIKDMLEIFLKRCLKEKERNGVDAKGLLGKCLEIVLPICNHNDVHKHAARYCEPTDDEETRYPRFVSWFNFILEKLNTLQTKDAGSVTLNSLGLRKPSSDGRQIMFHRTDPGIISTIHNDLRNKRKPDIAVVPLEHVRTRLDNTCQDYSCDELNKTATLAPDIGFNWEHFYSVLEFKLMDKEMDNPPARYTTGLKYVSAVPEVTALSPKNLVIGRSVPEQTLEPTQLPTKEPQVPNKLSLAQQIQQQRRKTLQPAATARTTRLVQRQVQKSDNTRKFANPSPIQSSTSAKVSDEKNKMQDKPPILQNAMYAAEMLCRGLYATHVITLLIVDEIAWIWWFDRQGAIQTTGIDFIQNLPYFVVLLVAFQRFDLEDWGIIEKLYKPSGYDSADPDSLRLVDIAVDQMPFTISTAKPYSTHFSLVGRGTRVLGGVAHEEDSEEEFSFKFYWPEETRQNEADILRKALALDNDITRDHLPTLIAHEDLGYSTANIRRELGISPPQGSLRIQPRVFRVLVFRTLDENKKWRAPAIFMRLWVEWYQCHQILWLNGIEHGDISLGNLMVNEETRGILNDFDLAILEGAHVVSGERTGTVPFMALDLLTREYYEGKIKRLYRHDLESFLWVLVFVTFTNSTKLGAELATWKTAHYHECWKAKVAFTRSAFADVEESVDKDQWKLTIALVKWLDKRGDVRRQVPYVPPPEQLDEEVLREFEDVVQGNWSNDWPAFNRLT